MLCRYDLTKECNSDSKNCTSCMLYQVRNKILELIQMRYMALDKSNYEICLEVVEKYIKLVT